MENIKKLSLILAIGLGACQIGNAIITREIKPVSAEGQADAGFVFLDTVSLITGNSILEEPVTSDDLATASAVTITTSEAIITTDSAIDEQLDESSANEQLDESSAQEDTISKVDTPKNTSNNSQKGKVKKKKVKKKKIKKISATIKQKGNRIVIHWNKITQASRYAIYLKKGKDKEYLWKTVKKKRITIKPTTGLKYSIRIKALTKKGKKLTTSKRCKFLLPEKVSNVKALPYSAKSVKLTWNKAVHASKYIIYRKVKTGKKYKIVGRRKSCRFLDKGLSSGKEYCYKIVPIYKLGNIRFTGTSGKASYSTKKIVSRNHQKYSYTEMEEDIKELTKKYQGLVHSKVIGKSEDGRNIYDVILGNQKAKKSILIVSTLHAREYMASLLCMNQMEYYLQNYYSKIDGVKVKSVLKEIAIHYIPMANPDGVTISQFGIESIRNLSLRQKLYKMNGDANTWKANAQGVDLNRNFPYKFEKFSSAGSEGFSGSSASSESETRAVITLTKTLKNSGLCGVINYHATGSIIFGDCKRKSPVKKVTTKMYRLARNITGYNNAAEYESSASDRGSAGNYREYVMYKKKLPSITLEIGTMPCPLSISEFPAIWDKNKSLILQEAKLLSQ